MAALTETQLAEWGVEYDEFVFSKSLQEKGQLCVSHRVDLFIDDQDECIADVPERVLVLKVRNGGNFDFDRCRWIVAIQCTRPPRSLLAELAVSATMIGVCPLLAQ